MFSKIGLLALPAARPAWMHSHAYIPNAFLLDARTIRIVVAFWDEQRVGRIGYLDTLVDDPLHAIDCSRTPALDVGSPGTFDDNGVSPLCVVALENALRLYYAGWQLSSRVRYLLFTGIAESRDQGLSFHRVRQTPVLERCDEELTIRTGGFVYPNGFGWSMIYAGGSATVTVGEKQLPSYDLRYLESHDGLHWPGAGVVALPVDPTRGEFGFGRPYIAREGELWKMWYGIRTQASGYSMGYAESQDGRHWHRLDERMDSFNSDQWPHDDRMRAFPSLVETRAGSFLFYNGNDYGKAGLCVAKLQTS